MNWINARLWQTDTLSATCSYPEDDYLPQHDKALGICFSGGGNRAFSASTGQIKALEELGLVDKARYFSAVSGGSWATGIYIYSGIDSHHLLGSIILNPSDLSLSYLDTAEPNFMGHCATENLYTGFNQYKGNVDDDLIWLNVVNDVYLKPYQLNEKKWMTFNQTTLSDFNQRNQSNFSTHQFYMPNNQLPYLIVNGTLIKHNKLLKRDLLIPVEYTPLYSGVMAGHEEDEQSLGRAYYETISFNGEDVKESNTTSLCAKQKTCCFSVQDMLGSSSAFFAAFMEGIPGLDDYAPRFNYYLNLDNSQPAESKNLIIGDGGNLENFGIIPMLIRQVDKLIVFVNSGEKFEEPSTNGLGLWKGIDPYIPPLFGEHSTFWRHIDGDIKTKVFPSEFLEGNAFSLIDQLLQANEAGKPLTCRMKIPVLDNEWLGIHSVKPSGEPYEVEILWVYLDMPASWYNQVPSAIQSELEKGEDGLFEDFPHYPTAGTEFEPSKPKTWHDLGGLSLSQVKLLSQLTYWTLMSQSNELRSFAGD